MSKDDARLLLEDHMALELKLTDVDLVIKHLLRKRLVSQKGAKHLMEEALKLELPPPAANEPQREGPSVDVDQLLMRWMAGWGSWDWKEDTALITSILSKFQPRSPSKRSPQKKKAASPSSP